MLCFFLLPLKTRTMFKGKWAWGKTAKEAYSPDATDTKG